MNDEMLAPESEDSSEGDVAQTMLMDGKALCEMGERMVMAAKEMGAVDPDGEDESPGDGYDDSSDSAEPPAEEAGSEDPSAQGKRAIIALIRKKMPKG